MRGNYADDKHSHVTAQDFFNWFPEDVVGRPFTFSIMREPIARTISVYNFRSRKALLDPSHPNHQLSTAHLSFDEFISSIEADIGIANLQSEYLFLPSGEVLDSIIRLENALSDIKSITPILPIEFNAEECFSKRLNKSTNIKMTEEDLNKSQRLRLEILLKPDLELYESTPSMISNTRIPGAATKDVEADRKFVEWATKEQPEIIAESLFCSALNLWRNREQERALAILNKIDALQPHLTGLSGLRALLYKQLGRKKEWTEEAEKCSRELTYDGITYFEGASWLYEQKKYQDAFEVIMGLLNYSDGTMKDYILLAKCTSKLSPGEFDLILPLLEQALERFSSYTHFVEQLKNLIAPQKKHITPM